mmetsp:Transcript_6129/g.17582  ORF Transcript_6129/g.17582 Transcript_6129/m.17582 type:complete len:410 (+) Transcript_6129:361-1590(+)
MGTRKVAADDGLPNGIDAGGTPESSVAVPLKTPHLGAGISQASLSTNGRQAESVENDHELDGYTTSATDDTQRAAAQRHQHIAHGPTSLEEIIQDSPFLDLSSPMTAYEWLKAVVMLPWVAIKLFLSVTGLIMVWAVTRVLVIGVKPNEPGSPWRFNIIRPWLRFWTGVFLRLGLSFWGAQVTGWEHFEEAERERAICVFNHHSYVDAIVMTHFFALSGVAKASVANIPFIGAIAVALQFLFVQRRGGMDARNKHTQLAGRTVDKIAARSLDNRFPLLMIAPEGTTKNTNVLLRFSTGAFVPGRPVLPVLLKYRHRHFNAGWGITYNIWHVYRLLCQVVNYLDVELLPVYYPSEQEVADPALYSLNVRKAMAAGLGATLTEHGFDQNVALKKNMVHVNFSGTKIVMSAK